MLDVTVAAFLSMVTGLPALLPGGIFAFSALGKKGLSSDNSLCATAFTLTHGMYLLNPCVVARVTENSPTYARHDPDTQETSTEAVLRLWFYHQDSYTAIETAADLAYKALQSRVNAGIGLTLHTQRLEGLSAPEFEGVSLWRDDYICKRLKRTA